MRGVPISDEVRDEIIAMSKVGGFTVDDISEETGASASTVSRVLAILDTSSLTHESGLNTNEVGSLESATFVRIAQRYTNGDLVNTICDEEKITIQQMYAVIREAGIETRSQSQDRERAKRMEDAIRMYVAGSPLWEINTATEISTFALNREIHKRGIPLRRPRKLVS